MFLINFKMAKWIITSKNPLSLLGRPKSLQHIKEQSKGFVVMKCRDHPPYYISTLLYFPVWGLLC